jgi:hypothetical protein
VLRGGGLLGARLLNDLSDGRRGPHATQPRTGSTTRSAAPAPLNQGTHNNNLAIRLLSASLRDRPARTYQSSQRDRPRQDWREAARGAGQYLGPDRGAAARSLRDDPRGKKAEDVGADLLPGQISGALAPPTWRSKSQRPGGVEAAPGQDPDHRVGRFALENRRARDQGKPETYAFLGFTHIFGRTRQGCRLIRRHTVRARLNAKLRQVKATLRRMRHLPIPEQGRYLRLVLNGF